MSQIANAAFRTEVDQFLDSLIQRFYDEVPFVKQMLTTSGLNLDYYKRHNIETVLRIRKKRTVDALAIGYFTKADPAMAKAWSEYTAEEMLHDALFLRDLQHVGVPAATVYATEPLLATKLLMGYLLYDIEYEGRPLALISSVYFIEYTTTRTQPQWLDNVERILGKEAVVGARAHVGTDVDGDHAGFVWKVLASLIKEPADERRVRDHMLNVYRLYVGYFTELYRLVAEDTKVTAVDLQGVSAV